MSNVTSTTPPKTPISPKVIFATIAAIVVPGIIAVITYVNANQEVLGINNPILGTLISAIVPGLLTFLAGYTKRDPIREAGALSSPVE